MHPASCRSTAMIPTMIPDRMPRSSSRARAVVGILRNSGRPAGRDPRQHAHDMIVQKPGISPAGMPGSTLG